MIKTYSFGNGPTTLHLAIDDKGMVDLAIEDLETGDHLYFSTMKAADAYQTLLSLAGFVRDHASVEPAKA